MLSSEESWFRRVWLLVAITTSVVLAPRLFPAAEPPQPPLEVALDVGRPDLAVVPEPQVRTSPAGGDMVVLEAMALKATTSTTAAAPPTTTTARPKPTTTPASSAATTPTTARARQRAAAATSATSAPAKKTAPSTTTTTAPSVAATVPPAPHVEQSDRTQLGDVSWYELDGARAGICAHRILDKGTVVTVTNVATGASITCTVGDRGPYSGDDKVLDLFRDDFARLAPLEEGVVRARLDW